MCTGKYRTRCAGALISFRFSEGGDSRLDLCGRGIHSHFSPFLNSVPISSAHVFRHCYFLLCFFTPFFFSPVFFQSSLLGFVQQPSHLRPSPGHQQLWGIVRRPSLLAWINSWSFSDKPPVMLRSAFCSSPQLRSAGAAVIQELFPRVSCVGTLDVSDNGEKLQPVGTPCSALAPLQPRWFSVAQKEALNGNTSYITFFNLRDESFSLCTNR